MIFLPPCKPGQRKEETFRTQVTGFVQLTWEASRTGLVKKKEAVRTEFENNDKCQVQMQRRGTQN